MTTAEPQQPRIIWQVGIDPFLIASALIAVAYGALGPGLFAQDNPPLFWLAVFKATPVFLLCFRAVATRGSMLLIYGLLFGCVGDAFLVWPDKFMHGAVAFLIGHLCYIRLFLREGAGISALKQPARLLAALALIAAAIGMTSVLVPRDNAMFVPLSIYTGVLTLMALTSFTLAATRWLAIAGAVLFFISDGFVAWNMFHPDPDPTLAFWRSFAGWMIYWAGQAGICMGMASFALRNPASPT